MNAVAAKKATTKKPTRSATKARPKRVAVQKSREYDANLLAEMSLAAIKEHNLIFMDDVPAYLPCSRSTFYLHQLNESDVLKTALYTNRINQKVGLRKKWHQSDAPVTQIALYKLLGTEEELERLNGTKQNITLTNPDGSPVLQAPHITQRELAMRIVLEAVKQGYSFADAVAALKSLDAPDLPAEVRNEVAGYLLESNEVN